MKGKGDAKPRRKWKRWVIPAALVLGILYYCGVFSGPLRITRENTGLTALPPGVEIPLRADGRGVDYVKAYEILFPEVSEITTENGWRDVVRALGVSIFSGRWWYEAPREQPSVGDLPQAYQTHWAESCRRLGLTPEEVMTPTLSYFSPENLAGTCAEMKLKAVFDDAAEDDSYTDDLAALDLTVWEFEEARREKFAKMHLGEIRDHLRQFARQRHLRLPDGWDADDGNSPCDGIESAVRRMHEEMFYVTGWSREEYPELAAWADTQSPALDLVAVAVRKPRYFIPFYIESNEQLLMERPRLDQYFQERLAHGFAVRATMYMHDGDAAKALADVESLYLLTGHLSRMPDASLMLWCEIADLAVVVTRGILARNICPPEQLAQLAALLESLPTPVSFKEVMVVNDWYEYILLGKKAKYDWMLFPGMPQWFYNSLDPNVATKRYAELVAMRYDRGQYDELKAICDRTGNQWITGLACARSRTAADMVFTVINKGKVWKYVYAERRKRSLHLTRLAIALKRYKTEHGAYPETLAALTPEYVARTEMPPGELPYVFHEGHTDLLDWTILSDAAPELPDVKITYAPEDGGFSLFYSPRDADKTEMSLEPCGDEYLIQVGN